MRYQEASAVITAPMTTVERSLSDVASWPAFLTGLAAVDPLGHERYRFHLADGPERRDAVVCVRHLFAAHRFTWKALDGPAYTGCLQVRRVDDRHVAVRLGLASQPGTFRAGLAEMVMPRPDRAADDLRRLEEHLLHPRR